MIHEGKIFWHDLLEDPSDLPVDDNSENTIITTLLMPDNSLVTCWDVYYDEEFDVWYIENSDERVDKLVGKYSQNKLKLIYEESNYVYNSLYEKYKVIAWAEFPEPHPIRRQHMI